MKRNQNKNENTTESWPSERSSSWIRQKVKNDEEIRRSGETSLLMIRRKADKKHWGVCDQARDIVIGSLKGSGGATGESNDPARDQIIDPLKGQEECKPERTPVI